MEFTYNIHKRRISKDPKSKHLVFFRLNKRFLKTASVCCISQYKLQIRTLKQNILIIISASSIGQEEHTNTSLLTRRLVSQKQKIIIIIFNMLLILVRYQLFYRYIHPENNTTVYLQTTVDYLFKVRK